LLFLEYAERLGHISYPGEALASFVLCPASLRHHARRSLGLESCSVANFLPIPFSCYVHIALLHYCTAWKATPCSISIIASYFFKSSALRALAAPQDGIDSDHPACEPLHNVSFTVLSKIRHTALYTVCAISAQMQPTAADCIIDRVAFCTRLLIQSSVSLLSGH
jgi:hypothetical protein